MSLDKKKRNMSKNNYSIDLIKQMAECDANYIRLLKLVPQLRSYRDRSAMVYPRLDSDISNHEEMKRTISNKEPEKILEGLTSEFCIADFYNSNQKVTVKIKILEAFKYTTIMEITQQPELKKWMTNSPMLVRVYHDASTAEVVSYQGHRNLRPRYSQPNPKMYHADEKMQVNKFLGECLTHCLKAGRSANVPELLFKI